MLCNKLRICYVYSITKKQCQGDKMNIVEDKRWEMNFLGDAWYFEGETEEDAERNFLSQMNMKTKEKYIMYCESVGRNPQLVWTEVK